MTNENPDTLLHCGACGLIAKPLVKMGGLVCEECRIIMVGSTHPLYTEIRNKLREENSDEE